MKILDENVNDYLIAEGLERYPVATIGAGLHHSHRGTRLDFTTRKFLIDIFKDNADFLSIKKSSQCGISEYLIIKAINESRLARNVIYVLPTYSMMSIFIKTRVDPSIVHTEYYRGLLNSSKNKSDSSIIKCFGPGSVIFVGAQTESSFISHPADTVIVDEIDRCNADNMSLIPSRLSASEHKKMFRVSNPSIEGFGIDTLYDESDQKKWYIKCGCGKWINPDFFRNVVRQESENVFVLRDKKAEEDSDINIVCDKCERPLDRNADGEWIPAYKKRSHSGYHVSKLFSSNDTINEIVRRFEEGLIDDSKLQAFYNMDLGLPYTPKGAKIDKTMIQNAVRSYKTQTYSYKPCVMGMDVGAVIHTVIAEIEQDALRLIYFGELNDENDVINKLRRFNVKSFVIDALPETRVSRKLCVSHPLAFMAYYTGSKGMLDVNAKKRTVSANRTVSLDSVKEYMMTGMMILPENCVKDNDFVDQLCSSTRVYDDQKDEYYWIKSGPDHYFHALAYMIMAKKILSMA